ncbi:hypothetical protein Tco_0329423 [Tanacetum coccineum]
METPKASAQDERLYACARYQVNPKVSHLHVVKRIFRYLKGQPKLGIWYLKDSPFDLVAYTDSDYARASLDRKSIIGGKAKKSVKLMMEKLFRMELELMLFWSTVMAKIINGKEQLHALVDGKKIIITESSIRRDLQLADEEGSAIPTDPHHTPTIIQSSTQPQKTQKPRKPKRKDTQVPQPSDPSENVADEAIYRSGGPRCQETMRDTTARTRFESVSKHSNDSLLARGNTLKSDKDRLKLDELMKLCTTLQNRVLDLEKTKTTQQNEIASLKRRVKKLEKKSRSRTHKLRRLYKVGLTARVESSSDEEYVNDEVNVVEEVADVINTSKLIVDADQVSAAGNVVSTAGDAKNVSAVTTTTATITTIDDITLAQALMEIKSTKPKKDLIRRDEEIALKLQDEFDEEERLSKEKAEKEKEANIALIETWDDIQAKIDADH